jgi:hypothetical protein
VIDSHHGNNGCGEPRTRKHDERTRFVAVLEIPLVESAETAVRVQIIKDVKKGKLK